MVLGAHFILLGFVLVFWRRWPRGGRLFDFGICFAISCAHSRTRSGDRKELLHHTCLNRADAHAQGEPWLEEIKATANDLFEPLALRYCSQLYFPSPLTALVTTYLHSGLHGRGCIRNSHPVIRRPCLERCNQACAPGANTAVQKQLHAVPLYHPVWRVPNCPFLCKANGFSGNHVPLRECTGARVSVEVTRPIDAKHLGITSAAVLPIHFVCAHVSRHQTFDGMPRLEPPNYHLEAYLGQATLSLSDLHW